MKIIETSLPDVKVIIPEIFKDPRGLFFESFNRQKFQNYIGYKVDFVQDNHSNSNKGVLRGLHYQIAPKAQGKLVRVVQGAVFDVAVDIRKSSPTFGQWVGEILSAKNNKQMWIPPGFAHGFLTLSNNTKFLYKTTDYYSPLHERSILWNDQELGIEWPDQKKIFLSEKDGEAMKLSQV